MNISFFKQYAPEYKRLLKLGFPVLLTELGIIAVSFADTMMVGAYGTRELAAAAFVNNFFMIPVVCLIGFASGLTPLIGSLYSQKNNLEAGRTLKVAVRVNGLMALAMTLVMLILYFFIDKMGQPPELLPLIRRYYLIILFTLVPAAVFNCCQQMANGVTDTAMPMWLILGCNLLNIIGNYALIYGHWGLPELGLAGAGWSTLTARVIGCAAILLLLRTRRRYSPYRTGWLTPQTGLRPLAVKVARTSYPIMIQSGIECLMWTLGAIVCGWFGAIQLASYQVVVTISQLGFMTYISFGIATSILVANYMGVADYRAIMRVASAGLHLNLLLCTLASAIFLIGGKHLLALFTEDAQVISAAMLLLPPLVLYQFSDAVQITYANALRGTSNVRPLLTISVIGYILVGCPALFALGVWMPYHAVGIYYSFSIALTVAAVLLWRTFRRTLTH